MYPLKIKAIYNPDNLAATGNIFTTVYLGNYVPGDYGEWDWSHPGVDMIPQVKHDNVLACLDWVVQFAGTSDSNWNYVVLKHVWAPDPDNLSSTTTLFSCHLHLSELDCKTWDSVKEWDAIGKTWNTWNSTWEHLHFQIDRSTAPFHPYWPFTFKDSTDAWLGFFEAVNRGLWIDNARKYTVNPLVYLDKVSQSKGNIWTAKPVTPSFSFAPKSKHFSDVSDNADAIDYLYDRWVTKWYWDWTFRPESNITRAELLIMSFVFAKITPTPNWNPFSDVAASDYYFPYISSASSKWYIKWYADGTFKPNNPVTRAEAIAIILNIVVWKDNIAVPTDSDFQDVKMSDWFCKYTNYISQNWLMETVWRFYPCDNMKRKDFADILFNLKDRI
jgi:hypothetical protein